MKLKEYNFFLHKSYNEFFEKRIKNKIDVIEILLKALGLILLMLNDPKINVRTSDDIWKITLIVDKMKRIFFLSDKKFFSINFPFTIWSDSKIYFWSIWIDSKIISELMKIILTQKDSNYLYTQLYWEIEGKYSDDTRKILNDLLIFEDGYIRYDYDEIRIKWKIHPFFHYDIFYSNPNTFKIWLNRWIKGKDFIDLLNINTNCHFIR